MTTATPGTYPCPRCQQIVSTRQAPSGATRLIRHLVKDRSKSCTGSGWVVAAP